MPSPGVPAKSPNLLNLPGAVPAFEIPEQYHYLIEKGGVQPELIASLGMMSTDAEMTASTLRGVYAWQRELEESIQIVKDTPVVRSANRIAAALMLHQDITAANTPPDRSPELSGYMSGLLRTAFTSFLAKEDHLDEEVFTNYGANRLSFMITAERYTRSLWLRYSSNEMVGGQSRPFARVALNPIFGYANADALGLPLTGSADISQVPGAITALLTDAAASFGPVWHQVPQIES